MSVVLVAAALLTALGAASLLRAHTRVPSGAESTAPPDGQRLRATLARGLGLVAGLVAAGVVLREDSLGRGLLLAVPVLGLGVLLGVLAGELTTRAPRGPTRRAELRPRRPLDYLPRRLTAAVGAATAVLVALLAATTALGSPDDLGRAGRSLARQCSEELWVARGPWPGSYYSVPLAVVLLAGLAATVLTLHRIAVRPRPSGPDASSAGDDALRRQAARVTTAAAGLLVTLPLVGVSVVAASAVLGLACPAPGWRAAAWLLLALVPAWLALLAWCATVVAAPGSPRAVARAPR